MTCDVLLKQNNNGFVATVLGLPECRVEAATRDGALEAARLCVSQRLADVEIVKMELDTPSKIAKLAGVFADEDPESWNEFLAAMKAYRQQLNDDPNVL